MLKTLFMWAFLCTAAPLVCAQSNITDDEDEFSSPDINLNEITVVAKSTIKKTDRTVIIPQKSKVDASTSGLDLLQRLTLPGITVNPLTGSISINSGGVLKLYINGIPANESQIAAIDPKNIIRIEYHEHPGVKYGDADAVLDYITRKKDNGGRLFLESMDCIGNGKWATIDELAAQYYAGKSAWAVNAGYMQLERNNWVRDYDEIWRYPDYDLVRTEKGLPVKVGNSTLNTDINYQYAYNAANLFSARFSLNIDNVPNKEEGDRHSLLTTSVSGDTTEIWEHTSEKSWQPALALYYRHIFDKAGTLSFNLEGSWLKSKNRHSYSEEMDGQKLCDIFSKTNGNKYGFFAEAIHEITLGTGVLTSGVRQSQSHTSNHYNFDYFAPRTTTIFNQAQSSIFTEYSLRLAKWGFVAGLTGQRQSTAQSSISLVKYSVLPTIGISFAPSSDIFLRYHAQMDCKMPPLASMSQITQEIQPGMLRRGNPYVKSFSTIAQDFAMSYTNKYVNINISVNYLSEANPVMNSVTFEDGLFVQTFKNQKYFRKLSTEAMIALNPWSDYLTLWVAPEFSRYFSHGDEYKLAKNIFRIHFGATASYKHLIFNASTMSGADNYMYGDEMITEKPMNMILVGYKGSTWTLQAGAFNLMKNYWMKTENFSPLTPFTSNAHCGRNTYFTIKFSLNMEFGKKREPKDDIIPNSSRIDMDSGIVNGLK